MKGDRDEGEGRLVKVRGVEEDVEEELGEERRGSGEW